MQINKNLMQQNHTPLKRSTQEFNWIVIHYVGALGDAWENTEYYKNSDVGASADFWVGFDGSIWQGNDYLNYYSWAIGGGLQGDGPHPYYQIALNRNSVSIEMCVHKRSCATMNATDRDWYFEDATVESAAWLTAHLMTELDIDINHVIRHYDVNAKICPNPFVYDNGRTTWSGFKDKVLGYLGGSGGGGTGGGTGGGGTGGGDVTYYVQAGAFTEKSNADLQAAKLTACGFDVYVAFIDGLYKIEAGAFKNRENAIAMQQKLSAAGFPAAITT